MLNSWIFLSYLLLYIPLAGYRLHRRHLPATEIETKQGRTLGHSHAAYLPLKDVLGFYLAPVPLEVPGKSGDCFVGGVLLRNRPYSRRDQNLRLA